MIENGYIDESPNVQIPYLSGVLSSNPPLYRSLSSAPDPQLGNLTFPVAVGNVVGGGSVVNGMMLDRGSDADYNAWEELGNAGWGWKGLESYFKKVFTFTPPSEKTVCSLPVQHSGVGACSDLCFDRPMRLISPIQKMPMERGQSRLP